MPPLSTQANESGSYQVSPYAAPSIISCRLAESDLSKDPRDGGGAAIRTAKELSQL